MARKKKSQIAEEELYTIDESQQMSFPGIAYNPASTSIIKKPNFLINSIGRATAMTMDATDYAISTLEYRDHKKYAMTREGAYFNELYEKTKSDFSDGYVAEFSMIEFRKEYGLTSGSSYGTIDKLFNDGGLVDSLKCLYCDDNIWSEMAVVIGTTYDKRTGKMFVKFNPDVGKLILEPKKNYTREDREITKKLRSKYSRRLYETFKKDYDREKGISRLKNMPEMEEYVTEYEVSYLKFVTQIIEIDTKQKDAKTREMMRHIKDENFSEAERVYEEENKKIKFAEFNRYALKRAFKDINGFEYTDNMDEYDEKCLEFHKTDIHFWYEPLRSGVNGETTKIKVYIKLDDPDAKAKVKAPEVVANVEPAKEIDIDEAIENIHDELIDLKLSFKDVKTVAKTAEYDLEKVKQAITVYRKYNKKHDVDNVCGFIIQAIKDSYEGDAAKSEAKELSPAEAYGRKNKQRIESMYESYVAKADKELGRIHLKTDK